MKKYLILLGLILITTLSFGQRTLTREKITTDTLASPDSIIKVIASLIPEDDSLFNLGSDALRWDTGYFDVIDVSKGSSITGASLDWIFPFPDSFSYRPPFHILKNPTTGAYLIDPAFNLQSYASVPKGVTYYVDVINGSDSNSGLTAALAFRSLHLAVVKTDVGRIYIDDGYYYKQYGWNGVTPTRSFELIATGDDCKITMDVSNTLALAIEGNLYKTHTTTDPGKIWDMTRTDAYGDPHTLKEYASRAQVDTSTVGAWYWAADTLYIRLVGNANPVGNTAVFASGFNVLIDGEGLKYYFQGFTLWGGGITISNVDGSQGGCNLYMDSVNIVGGFAFVDGVTECFMFNGSIHKTQGGDLINYDPENGVYTSYIENNMRVFNNRDNGAVGTTDQASTAHIGSRGIRLNSFYGYTNGQGVADVDSNQSWLINCEVDSGTSNANYFFGTGDKCYAWLQDCESYNRPIGGYDIDGTGANIYINGFISDNYDYGVSTGNLDSNYSYQLYEPTEAALVERVFDTRIKGRLPSGSNNQTMYFSGTTLTTTSFLRTNNTSVSIGDAGAALGSTLALAVRQNANAIFSLSTASSGAERTIQLGGTDGIWYMGAQNTINSGELRINRSGIPLTPFLGIGITGNIGMGIASSSTYKLNLEGNMRIATSTTSTNGTDSIFVRSSVGEVKIMPFKQGVYLPVDSAGSNVDGVTPDTAFYTRIGDIITVQGVIEIDPTTTLTPTFFYMNVPVFPLNWNTNRAGGTFNAYIVNEGGAVIMGGPTSVLFQFNPTATGANIFSYSYSYRIE